MSLYITKNEIFNFWGLAPILKWKDIYIVKIFKRDDVQPKRDGSKINIQILLLTEKVTTQNQSIWKFFSCHFLSIIFYLPFLPCFYSSPDREIFMIQNSEVYFPLLVYQQIVVSENQQAKGTLLPVYIKFWSWKDHIFVSLTSSLMEISTTNKYTYTENKPSCFALRRENYFLMMSLRTAFSTVSTDGK